MDAKGLVALILAAAIGGPAWGQVEWRDPFADPGAQAPTDDADAASLYGAASGATAGGTQNPYDLKPAHGPNAPYSDPYAKPLAADPYGGDATFRYGSIGGPTSGEEPNPNDVQTAPGAYAADPYGPGSNPYANPFAPGGNPYARANIYGAEAPANDHGLDQGLGQRFYNPLAGPGRPSPSGGARAANPYAANPSGAGKPRTEGLNSDPLGALGFNPYDPNSLLAPDTRPASPAASAAGSGALGSMLSPSSSTPTTSDHGTAGLDGAGAGDPFGAANASLSSPGFPTLGPTTPGGPAQ